MDDLLAEVARRGPALAVVAHPDDESFGLGAVLGALAAAGAEVRVLCFTHGEMSTLGEAPGLGDVRRRELASAARRLGLASAALCRFPDGGLDRVPAGVLDAVAEAHLCGVATLVVFDPGGVTGHPDHRAATAAAYRAARRRRLPVLEWGVAPAVAAGLNAELGTGFVALAGEDAVDVVVERRAQLAAIACHASQATGNAVLRRRLQLEGDTERVRLRPPDTDRRTGDLFLRDRALRP